MPRTRESESLKEFLPAFRAARAELVGLSVDKDGYTYRYLTLQKMVREIEKAFNANKLSFSQEEIFLDEGERDKMIAIETSIYHDSGEFRRYVVRTPRMDIDADARKKSRAQEYGSSLTYCKRYGLASAIGIAAEKDDDAHLELSGTDITSLINNNNISDVVTNKAKNYYKVASFHELNQHQLVQCRNELLKFIADENANIFENNNNNSQQNNNNSKEIVQFKKTQDNNNNDFAKKQPIIKNINNLIIKNNISTQAVALVMKNLKIKNWEEATIQQLADISNKWSKKDAALQNS